jgi:hypothetical protein
VGLDEDDVAGVGERTGAHAVQGEPHDDEHAGLRRTEDHGGNTAGSRSPGDQPPPVDDVDEDAVGRLGHGGGDVEQLVREADVGQP